jgi:hypothetical protein
MNVAEREESKAHSAINVSKIYLKPEQKIALHAQTHNTRKNGPFLFKTCPAKLRR